MKVELRQIQMLELEIAKEFKRICEKNQIPYFLIGGTLLGAVRHQGFIPWDDDMDVGLRLEDFERFLSIAREEMDDRFLLQTWEDGDDYGYIYAKMKLKDTEAVETICEGLSMNKGVWLDIFPYAACSDKTAKSKLLRYRLKVLSRSVLIRNGYQLNKVTTNKASRVVNNVLGVLTKLCSRQFLHNRTKSLLYKQVDKDGTWLYQWDGMYSGKFIFPINFFDELVELPFEDQVFWVPKNFKLYLQTAYGDYLKLPPVEEREKGHSLEKVILHKSYEEYFR